MRRFVRLPLVLAFGALSVVVPAEATEPVMPECRPLTVPAHSSNPFGVNVPCPGVRPGGYVETSEGFCTLNFVWRGSDGYRYIGTAGHCILGEQLSNADVGEVVWGYGRGPIAYDSNGRRIGRFAYAILKQPKDFALIRIDKNVPASQRVCHFGGPTRLDTRYTGGGMVHYFGNGIGLGDVMQARTAYANSFASRDHVFAYGPVVPGDSGGPLLSDDGRALGVVVTTGVHLATDEDHGIMGAVRLPPVLARATYRLRIKLTMYTASLL